MSVIFSSSLTVRDYLWTDWKTIYNSRKFSYQYEDNGETYFIWGYDGPEVHTTIIYKNAVPDGIIINYTQSQNDSDKSDFETNYKTNGNSTIVKLAVTGVDAHAPSKGLGGFIPDPSTNPYSPDVDEVVSHYTDSQGALVVRGQSFSDEGSLRDDFTGSSLHNNLTGTITFTNGSVTVTGSGTIFTSELDRDYYIRLSTDSDSNLAAVYRIINDTTLVLATPYTGTSGSGTAIASRWLSYNSGNGSISVSSSMMNVLSGTNSGNMVIYRDGDYAPQIEAWRASISQRIANQTSFLGFRDDVNSPSMYCDIIFDGTDNTSIKFRSAWNSDEQLTTITLPSGLDTTQILNYKIDLAVDYCSLLINGVLVAKHEEHIPDMYATMYLCCGIENSTTVTNTTLTVDTFYWLNLDQTQISTSFRAPISIVTTEDQHTITGVLTTTSTSSDQIIVSYTVPSDKVLYIIGYRIESSGTLNGTPVKIGKNNVSSEPSSPGSVDGNIFRSFVLNAGVSTGDVDFGGNPRKLGIGGDTVKVTVTPSGLLSSTWRASIDFVLR